MFGYFKEQREKRLKQEELIKNRIKKHNDFIKNLKKPHELMKMFVRTTNIKGQKTNSKKESSAAFFLIMGGSDSSEISSSEPINYNKTKVILSWDYNGEFIISEIPLSKVRIKYGDKPSVSIHLKSRIVNNDDYYLSDWEISSGYYLIRNRFNNNTQLFLNKNLAYIVVTCKKEDWSEQIQLPLNNKDDNSSNILGIDKDN
ncbi:hypothetical protein COB55_05115 [Candidatus Wolfebacteria bacterium]|nr:MAG: hypothetical protein COB55_05115 [Candidatus Wolfebacteria bacterium]